MKENFTEDQLQDIFYNMKKIEPAFNNWNQEQLRNLTQAIFKCGYSFMQQDKDIGFFHPKNQLILNFKGLHYYTPETIIDTYKRVWSKDSLGNKIKGELKVKVFKSMLLWLFSFSILFFVDFKYAVYLILLLFIRFIYFIIKSRGYNNA